MLFKRQNFQTTNVRKPIKGCKNPDFRLVSFERKYKIAP